MPFPTHTRETQSIAHSPCDILIHLGDACNDGNEEELKDFFVWFANQKAQHKIFVAGNHDLPFEFYPDDAVKMIPKNILLMENSIVELGGLVIATVKASPWMLDTIEINEPIDLLLSHGAPLGVLDNGIGCPKLKTLIEKQQPRYALFGHIHRNKYALVRYNETKCVNVCNDDLLNKNN